MNNRKVKVIKNSNGYYVAFIRKGDTTYAGRSKVRQLAVLEALELSINAGKVA